MSDVLLVAILAGDQAAVENLGSGWFQDLDPSRVQYFLTMQTWRPSIAATGAAVERALAAWMGRCQQTPLRTRSRNSSGRPSNGPNAQLRGRILAIECAARPDDRTP